MSTPNEQALIFALAKYAAEFEDISDCPYFRSEGTCGYTCGSSPSPEPECMTMRPQNGWPMEELPAPLRDAVDEAINGLEVGS